MMAGTSVPVSAPIQSPLPTVDGLSYGGRAYRIRPAEAHDLECLRAWRNAHASAFYDTRPIGAEAQRAWFARFRADATQQIYLLEDDAGPVACVGLRVFAVDTTDGLVLDLFNVIAGEARARGTGLMSAFYQALAAAARAAGVAALRAEVRVDNPGARRWYQRQGFAPVEQRPACHVLVHTLRVDA